MFVVFEGIDNSGKTFQAGAVRKELVLGGHTVRVRKNLFLKLAEVLQRQSDLGKLPLAVASFLNAARAAFGADERERDPGEIVIIDRFVHTIIAHGRAGDMDVTWIEGVRRTELYDVGIYIDITPEEAVRRAEFPGAEMEYSAEYLEQIRNHYLRFVEAGELILIDGMRDREMVTRDIMKILEKRL